MALDDERSPDQPIKGIEVNGRSYHMTVRSSRPLISFQRINSPRVSLLWRPFGSRGVATTSSFFSTRSALSMLCPHLPHLSSREAIHKSSLVLVLVLCINQEMRPGSKPGRQAQMKVAEAQLIGGERHRKHARISNDREHSWWGVRV